MRVFFVGFLNWTCVVQFACNTWALSKIL